LVSRVIDVRFHDFAVVERFVSETLGAGVQYIQKFQYRLRDQAPHQIHARRIAVGYAKEKASHLAELNGMRLGKALHIGEDVEWNSRTGGQTGMGGFFAVSEAPVTKQRHAAKPRLTGGSSASEVSGRQDDRRIGEEKQGKQAESGEPNPEDLIAPSHVMIRATVTIMFELVNVE